MKRSINKPILRMKRDLLNAAKELDIPVLPFIEETDYWQFGWGKNSRVFYYSSPFDDGHHGVKISKDKLESKRLLMSIGIPVPKSRIITSSIEFEKIIHEITYPCVVKPTSGSGGAGITTNIMHLKDLKQAYIDARNSKFGKKPILIEEFIEGDDFRLIVTYGKFLSAIRRRPPFIIGDGISTIEELILKKNIMITQKILKHLKRFSLTLNSILKNKEKIMLSSTANLVSGGEGKDVSHLIHPQLKQMAEELAKVTNIAILGIDYITSDITKPFYKTNGAVTEFNHYISLSSADFYYDKQVFFEKIFGTLPSRIPVVLFIVDKKKQKLFLENLKNNIDENTFGIICNHKIYLGNYNLKVINYSFDSSIKILLRQKSLEKAILVCEEKEILIKEIIIDNFTSVYAHNCSNLKLLKEKLNLDDNFKEINDLEKTILETLEKLK